MKQELDSINAARQVKCRTLNKLSEALGEDSHLECSDLPVIKVSALPRVTEVNQTEIVEHKNGESFYVKAKKFFTGSRNGHGEK